MTRWEPAAMQTQATVVAVQAVSQDISLRQEHVEYMVTFFPNKMKVFFFVVNTYYLKLVEIRCCDN
jgi:hypothetical protein